MAGADPGVAAPAPAAVLFDLDGTLVDSLPALRTAYQRFLSAHGRTGSDEEFERWNGPPLGEVVRGLVAAHGIPGPAEARLREYEALLDQCYRSVAALAPGARELVDRLAASGTLLAVVTSAPRSLAEAILARHGVRARFSCVVGGDEVARGKPAPDPYRAALAALGVPAVRAVAVEDSPSGVASARGAGIRCAALAATPAARARISAARPLALATDLDEAGRILALLDDRVRATPARHLEVRLPPGERPRDEELERAVDLRWAAAVAARPELFDGEIVALVDLVVAQRRAELTVRRARYRHFLAQRAGIALGLRTLGVSGVTRLADRRVVLGRRAGWVTQYPGCFELIPSGGVEPRWISDGRIDPELPLREELEQELGLGARSVRGVRPLGLLDDRAEQVVDLGLLVETSADEVEVRAGIAGRREYSELAVMMPAEVLGFCARATPVAMVPTVPALLELLALDEDAAESG